MTSSLSWLSVERLDTYLRTPALLLALKGWVEIEEKGYGDGNQIISWDQPAIVGFDRRDHTACGIIIDHHKNKSSMLFVRLGYVKASHRGQGIYTRLWSELILQAKEEKAKRIVGAMHADNAPMRRLAVKLGRTQTPLVEYEQFLHFDGQ